MRFNLLTITLILALILSIAFLIKKLIDNDGSELYPIIIPIVIFSALLIKYRNFDPKGK